ncbi:MAG TPA: DUF1778 domain-containing protein [Alphaproteobacteria bacterium]
MTRKQTKAERDLPTRAERLGFRLDEETKELIERAAHLERRKLTDFCVTALADAARRTIAEHETLVLSERDRQAFFAALINPPKPNDRLVRALAEHKRRIGR